MKESKDLKPSMRCPCNCCVGEESGHVGGGVSRHSVVCELHALVLHALGLNEIILTIQQQMGVQCHSIVGVHPKEGTSHQRIGPACYPVIVMVSQASGRCILSTRHCIFLHNHIPLLRLALIVVQDATSPCGGTAAGLRLLQWGDAPPSHF